MIKVLPGITHQMRLDHKTDDADFFKCDECPAIYIIDKDGLTKINSTPYIGHKYGDVGLEAQVEG